MSMMKSQSERARTRYPMIQANGAASRSRLQLTAAVSNWSDIEADGSSQGAERKLRRFEMVAYTGAAMVLAGWDAPVVVDLSGIKVRGSAQPILKDHSPSMVVGHTESVGVEAGQLRVAGVVSGAGRVAKEVIEASLNGFPWQASVGARPDPERVEFVKRGKSATANGQTFEGPCYIVRASTLKEVSFVAMGADDGTIARIAANGGESGADDEGNDDGAGSDEHVNANAGVLSMRAEASRISRIQTICAQHPDLQARAIAEGWSIDKAELHVLRASRATGGFNINQGTPPLNRRVLEAALSLSGGIQETRLLRDFGEQTMEAASHLRSIGLRELAAQCARMEGKHVPTVFGDGSATIQAAFTTLSLPAILESTMERRLLDSFEAVPSVALEVCAIGSAKDFREVSRTRLLGGGQWQKVAQDGELKSARLSQEEFKNQVETRGVLITLTRQDVINDDLGAFLQLPAQIGADGSASIDDDFFTKLLANASSFFGTGNANYLEGASTAFGVDSLSAARAQFRKQKAGPGSATADKRPINVAPVRLLVPVEIETDAQILLGSAQIMTEGSSGKTKTPVDNPHRNKYQLSSAPHLSDTYYSGNSAKAWYLFADPKQVAAYEVVFLNGRQQPTIERTPTPANVLGLSWAAYIDFGVRAQDPRGAIKVKGEA